MSRTRKKGPKSAAAHEKWPITTITDVWLVIVVFDDAIFRAALSILIVLDTLVVAEHAVIVIK